MPRALAVSIRQQIIHHYQEGATYGEIADELALSYWSVRTIVRRYRDQGEAGLVPQYSNCGNPESRLPKRMYRAARWLKRHHPRWGGGFIRVLLRERWGDEGLPSERTLQRWFRLSGLSVPQSRRLPSHHRQSAHVVHEVWQLDATSHIRLLDGSGASWITLVDEASGAFLESHAFPPLCV